MSSLHDVMEMGNGVRLVIYPMPVLAPASIRTAYLKENRAPEVPTYTTKAAGDVEVVFNHDATTVSTPEEKEKWAQYVVDVEKWKTGLAVKMLNFFLAECTDIQVEDESIYEEWNERLELYGVEPKTALQKKLAYIQHFVVTDQETLSKVSERISELTGIKKADLEAAEKLF